LTTEGERVALHVLRAHRLWEVYLAEELGMPLDRVHAEAERHEHRLSPQQVDRLSAAMGHPDVDPHGDPIPGADGVAPQAPGTALSAWPLSTPARIVHLEDEPPLAYAQLTAEGLKLGQVVRVIERTPSRIVLSDGENEHRLAPMLAANVHVAAVSKEAEVPLEASFPLPHCRPARQRTSWRSIPRSAASPAGVSSTLVLLRARGFAASCSRSQVIRAPIDCEAPPLRCAGNNPIACS
jgi:hypothetical protein